MTIISTILALLKAVPIFDSWFRGLALAYGEWKVKEFDKAFTKGMADLIAKHDQRALEDALGMKEGPSDDQTDVVRRPHKDEQ